MQGSRYKPTTEDRARVEAMGAHGVPQDQIAAYIGIAEKTLRKHFRRELDSSKGATTYKVSKALVQNAVNGNVTAQIFWLKTQAGFRETTAVDLSSEDGSMSPAKAAPVIDASQLSTEALEEIMAVMDGGKARGGGEEKGG